MKKILILLIVLFFISCATPSYRGGLGKYSSSDYVYIDDFCKKHNFQYNFDTLDDIIKIFSKGTDIRLVMNSNSVYYNGAIFSTKNIPIYSNGKLFLPHDLEKIISSSEKIALPLEFNVRTIVVDPGHGGKDPGAISCRGLKEKDLNLKIAKYLKDELEERGFKVILTRSKDVYLTLQERVNVAKRYSADIFISIHGNSNRSRQMKGAEVYYLTPSRLDSQERAVKLAKEEKFYSYNLPYDAKAILWDLVLTKNYGLSVDLSQSIYFSFKNLGFKVDPPKKAPFYVLRLAYVPSVLVETGYLSNRYEEKWLRKDSYQMQIAEAIALAVASMNKGDKNFASAR